MDVEELIAEEKRLVDTFKKDADMYGKKEKIIQSALETAEKDLTLFQLDKQRKLNELNTIVPLKMHQILYFGLNCRHNFDMSLDTDSSAVNNRVPTNMESVLIFESNQIEKLKQNIVELQRQKSMQMKEYKEVRLMQVRASVKY